MLELKSNQLRILAEMTGQARNVQKMIIFYIYFIFQFYKNNCG
jgi:hypothetical protein